MLQVQQLQIPASTTLDLAGFLADPATVRQWNLQGLPAGSFSIQNGILITRSQRWPLIVDPQVRLPSPGKGTQIVPIQNDLLVQSLQIKSTVLILSTNICTSSIGTGFQDDQAPFAWSCILPHVA